MEFLKYDWFLFYMELENIWCMCVRVCWQLERWQWKSFRILSDSGSASTTIDQSDVYFESK